MNIGLLYFCDLTKIKNVLLVVVAAAASIYIEFGLVANFNPKYTTVSHALRISNTQRRSSTTD